MQRKVKIFLLFDTRSFKKVVPTNMDLRFQRVMIYTLLAIVLPATSHFPKSALGKIQMKANTRKRITCEKK